MARNPKPVKIKRHKNSMGSSAQSMAALKRYLPFILAGLLVLAVGFMLGKPLLNLISGGGDDSSSPEIVVSQPDSSITEENTGATQPDSSEIVQPVIPPVTETKNRIYYYTDVSALTTEGGIEAVIRTMKNAGATHLVFDAKNADGYVHYASAHRYASQLLSPVQIDIAALAAQLKKEGITPVARVYTFMDKMVSTVERATAVMYLGSEGTRWLDSSVALGGKSWANPASKLMQDYIIALTDELLTMGVTEIIYAGFSTPTGYSLDKRDFGATTQQVLANMQSLIGTLQAKISAKGGYSVWQFEYSAIAEDGSYEQYIVHPYQLGAENMIITARGADIDVAAAAAALTAAENQEDIGEITLWLTDNMNTADSHSLGSYFAS